jgi:hypothetical protein
MYDALIEYGKLSMYLIRIVAFKEEYLWRGDEKMVLFQGQWSHRD